MIALLALIVLGPEKLPKLAAKLGHWTGRARVMARNLRTQLEQEVSYEDLLKQKKEAEDALRRAQEAPMNFHTEMQTAAQSVQSDLGDIANDTPAPSHTEAPGTPDSNPAISSTPADEATIHSPAKRDAVTSPHSDPIPGTPS